MSAFQWALLIVLGCILGAVSAWGMTLNNRLLDIRAELRRVNRSR